MAGWLTCSCCGALIEDTPEGNVDHGRVPNPHDEGFGQCRSCGGDDKADDSTDEGFRKKMGWAACTFAEARFGIVREALCEENRAKWDGLPYWKRMSFVFDLVEKGMMT